MISMRSTEMSGSSMSLGPTFGALLVASWLATMSTGLVFFHAALYFRDRPKDEPKLFNYMVLSLCILDTAHILSLFISVYNYLITGFGDKQNPPGFSFTLAFSFGITAVVALIVQSFFCWRLWKIHGIFKYIIPVVVSLLLVRLLLSLASAGEVLHLGFHADLVSKWFFPAQVGLDVVCDLTATAGLCIWLYMSRAKALSMKSTMDTIIMGTMTNGVLTGAFSAASLICYLTMSNFVYLAFHTVVGKLFINSFIAAMHMKNTFRERRNEVVISGLSFAAPPSASESGTAAR